MNDANVDSLFQKQDCTKETTSSMRPNSESLPSTFLPSYKLHSFLYSI